mgnify:CR=1 FL=1|jgi:hypothetical protein
MEVQGRCDLDPRGSSGLSPAHLEFIHSIAPPPPPQPPHQSTEAAIRAARPECTKRPPHPEHRVESYILALLRSIFGAVHFVREAADAPAIPQSDERAVSFVEAHLSHMPATQNENTIQEQLPKRQVLVEREVREHGSPVTAYGHDVWLMDTQHLWLPPPGFGSSSAADAAWTP